MTLTLMNNGFNEKASFNFQKWLWDGVPEGKCTHSNRTSTMASCVSGIFLVK